MVERQAPLPFWCTFIDARTAGLHVRRGSKGVRLGLGDAPTGVGRREGCVFNVMDLVGSPLQHLLARRRKIRQQPSENPQSHCARQCHYARQLRKQVLSMVEGPNPPETTVRLAEEFLFELAWSLLTDRLRLPKQSEDFVLEEADWIEVLQESPRRFIALLSDASRVVDLFMEET